MQGATSMNVLLVTVRGAKFGVPADKVVEIIRAVGLSPLPGAPAVISGVINVRGSITPVLDPAVRFGHAENPVRPEDNFVLIETPSRTIALRVESADELTEIADEDVRNASAISSTARRLAGVATLPDGLVVIYDPASFLDEAENEALAGALELVTP